MTIGCGKWLQQKRPDCLLLINVCLDFVTYVHVGHLIVIVYKTRQYHSNCDEYWWVFHEDVNAFKYVMVNVERINPAATKLGALRVWYTDTEYSNIRTLQNTCTLLERTAFIIHMYW